MRINGEEEYAVKNNKWCYNVMGFVAKYKLLHCEWLNHVYAKITDTSYVCYNRDSLITIQRYRSDLKKKKGRRGYVQCKR